MNTFVHEGTTLVVPAPREVFGGEGVSIGSIFGIASSWAENAQPVAIATRGVFDVKKDNREQWRIGQRIYWDAENNTFTGKLETGLFVAVSVEDTKPASENGRVRLNGVAL